MCWLSKYLPLKETTTYPLIVYKVVVYTSPLRCNSLITWFDYIYKREYVEYNLEVTERKYAYGWEIYKGFHSYAHLNKAIEEYKAISSNHSDIALVECIIPKGSTFYKNEKDEIVSNRIIINRILKTNAKLPCAWNIIKLFIIILLSCFILFKLFIS